MIVADWIVWLQSIGLGDVIIPFFLVFAIAFAVLTRSKILGEPRVAKKFNAIISLALGFAVVVPHILWGNPNPANPYLATGMVDIVKLINNSLPQVAVVIVGIMMLLLMIGAFGVRWKVGESGVGPIVVIASIAIVVYIFGTNAGWFNHGRFPPLLYWLSNPQTAMLLVTLLVFGVIMWLITRDDEPKPNQKSFMENMKEMFKTEDYK